jgi:hypothetical protein
MADAIPTPAGQTAPQAQSTVVVATQPSVWQALKEAGWWTRYDWVMVSLLAGLWVVTGFWLLFSTPRPEGPTHAVVLLYVFLASLSLKLLWLISLVFRCSWFVLKAHADIALLPHASARIAAAFLAGQK